MKPGALTMAGNGIGIGAVRFVTIAWSGHQTIQVKSRR
jgi:hypothetical protein